MLVGCAKVKKPLLDVIFASEKRKGVLLLLHEGAKGIEELLKSLKTSRQALLPQMKILQEHYLVIYTGEIYQLTTIGRSVVEKMVPLLGTTDVLNSDIDYWGTHDLDFIPSTLLKRINELGKCNIVNTSITDIYEINKTFHESSLISESSFVITTFLYPNYENLFRDLAGNNVNVHFILSRETFAQLRPEHHTFFKGLATNKLVRLFVHAKKMNFISLAFNDHCTIVDLARYDGQMDTKFVISHSPDAREWAKEIFEHYLSESLPMHEFKLS